MKNLRLTANFTTLITKPIHLCIQLLKYWTPWGYRAEKYWSNRHTKYQFNLQGVGNAALNNEKNEQMYLEAKDVFLSLCNQLEIDFSKGKILDIGCGNGFYTKIFHDNGATKYLGLDITDVLIKQISNHFLEFEFHKLDICSDVLNTRFDLIIMIDVTQHITNEQKFSFAMKNIKDALSENGIFIVTSWLKKDCRKRFYEVSRSIEAYQEQFSGFIFTQPINFRDKFIFAIKKI